MVHLLPPSISPSLTLTLREVEPAQMVSGALHIAVPDGVGRMSKVTSEREGAGANGSMMQRIDKVR